MFSELQWGWGQSMEGIQGVHVNAPEFYAKLCRKKRNMSFSAEQVNNFFLVLKEVHSQEK